MNISQEYHIRLTISQINYLFESSKLKVTLFTVMKQRARVNDKAVHEEKSRRLLILAHFTEECHQFKQRNAKPGATLITYGVSERNSSSSLGKHICGQIVVLVEIMSYGRNLTLRNRERREWILARIQSREL